MAGQPRARRQARPMIARTSFSIAATRYCCLQILSAGRREWCQGHCVVGLLLITALMRSLGRAVGVAGGAGDVGLAVAAVVSDGGVAQHGGDGGAVAGAGLVSVLAEGDVAGADLTPLPQIVTALHRARPAPTIEDDMDNLAPEAPEAPDEATVTTTAADLATLLGPDAADRYQLDRLHVADSLDNALTHLERQLLRRARIAADHDGSDLTTLHHHHHDDDQPLPPIVFLTQAPEGTITTALAAILAVGSRLAIAGVLLGPWSAGATWHVNTDGTTRPDHATDTTGPRLNVLAPAATGDLLDTLRQARPASNALPPPPPRQAPPILRTAVAPMPASPATSAAPPAVEVHSGAPTPATAPATAITQPQVPPDSGAV